MKTLEELRHYYNTSLLQELGALESRRKRIAKRIIFSAGILAAAALFLGVFLLPSLPLNTFVAVFGGVVIGGGVLIFITNARDYANYRAEFKRSIIFRIVSFVDGRLQYSAGGCVPEPLFRQSKIFQRKPDRYYGDDFVSGKAGETQMEFSEVHAKYKEERRDMKGRKQTEWHDIFNGLFFVADFNKNFNGITVVLPDTAEKLFGATVGQMFQSWNRPRGELIKLEDPEFEKMFVVYGDDQLEARYILSPGLMQRIKDFRKKAGKEIYISFSGSKLFVAIPYRKSLFEPRLFKTMLDFQPIQGYFEDLQLAMGIVEDLNLNTRIWGKQ